MMFFLLNDILPNLLTLIRTAINSYQTKKICRCCCTPLGYLFVVRSLPRVSERELTLGGLPSPYKQFFFRKVVKVIHFLQDSNNFQRSGKDFPNCRCFFGKTLNGKYIQRTRSFTTRYGLEKWIINSIFTRQPYFEVDFHGKEPFLRFSLQKCVFLHLKKGRFT